MVTVAPMIGSSFSSTTVPLMSISLPISPDLKWLMLWGGNFDLPFC